MGKYGDRYCARQLCRLPHSAPNPSDPRGHTRFKCRQAMLATMKLKSYRQQAVTVTHYPSTSCKLYSCESSEWLLLESHQQQLPTTTIVVQILNDNYYYSHTSDTWWLRLQSHKYWLMTTTIVTQTMANDYYYSHRAIINDYYYSHTDTDWRLLRRTAIINDCYYSHIDNG